jgi:hypothetical protein
MCRFILLSSILLVFAVVTVESRPPLPVVEEVEWTPLRDDCRRLLKALDQRDSPLPARTVRELTTLLDHNPDDAALACAAVQRLLDPHCLLAVSINAESRVKAERGPAVARLQVNRPALVLLKVHNDGGVTHALRLRGPELLRPGERGANRWLEASLLTEAPFAPHLSGRRLEYRLLSLTPREAGKREATFQFDVGQGTQDLGFRAETPILFTIRDRH